MPNICAPWASEYKASAGLPNVPAVLAGTANVVADASCSMPLLMFARVCRLHWVIECALQRLIPTIARTYKCRSLPIDVIFV